MRAPDRAIFLALVGRRAEALADIAKIDQLDYGFSAAYSESTAYTELRDYPHLIDSSRRALLFDPKDGFQHYSLGVGYEGTGKLHEAIPEYQKAIETSGGSPGPPLRWPTPTQLSAKKPKRRSCSDLESNSKATASPYTVATIYAGLGENYKALESLEKVRSEKSFQIVR